MPLRFPDSPISLGSSLPNLDGPVYEALLDTIDQSVILTDVEGRIRLWNSGATRIFGYPVEEMLGKTPALLYPDESPDRFAEDLERILGGEDFVGEWCGRRRDGTTVWIEIRTTVVRDPAGTPIGFLGVGREVTEQSRTESAERKHQVLEAMARLKAMLGETRFLLSRTDISGTVRQEVTRIQRGAERISEITRHLLSSNRGRLGQPQLLDLNGAITRFQVDLEQALGDGVELALRLSPELPPVRMDESQLQQGLTALARDTREALPQGGTVFLEAREVNFPGSSSSADRVVVAPGRYVELMVWNLAAGADAATVAPLAQPFLNTEQPLDSGPGLTGLYWIVRQSGGYLFSDFSRAGGARFRILLPALSHD